MFCSLLACLSVKLSLKHLPAYLQTPSQHLFIPLNYSQTTPKLPLNTYFYDLSFSSVDVGQAGTPIKGGAGGELESALQEESWVSS